MSSRRKRLVIIGNGGAGLSAIRAIRSVDQASSIVLLSSEDCFAYSPAATTYYIAGKINRGQIFITDERFYRKYDVEILLKRKVLEIDIEKTSLVLAGKERIFYDELLIATGASPMVPAEDQEGRVLPLRTLEDAERILSFLPSSQKAVILGGGLVGLQLAQTLWNRGIEVTVVVGSDHILSRNVDQETSRWAQREIEARGVSFHLGTEVVSFEKAGEGVRVQLSTGRVLSSPLLLSGKGVRPNLLRGPLSSDGDMAVDDHMRTRVENVYAAGDVSLIRHRISGRWERLANWPNACYQGWVAGLNMAGIKTKLDGLVNQNVTHLFGLQLATLGLFKPPFENETQVVQWSDERKRVYRRIFLNQGKIVGAVLVNGIEDIGLIRSLMVRGIDVSGEKLNGANLLSSHFLCRVARQSPMTLRTKTI